MRAKQRSSITEHTNALIEKHSFLKKWQRMVSLLAAAVVLCATYAMILPAIAMDNQNNSAKLLSATGDTYVGYSIAASDGEVDFANGGGGGGVRKYYLAPYSVYYQYKDSSESTLQQQLLAESEIAYCFNFNSTSPYTVYESKNYPSSKPFTFYDERESTSASLFYNNATDPRSGYSQNALYQRILTVAMNGYPNDDSNICSKYNLTTDEFRFITQYAIWYYTDSISLRFKTTENGQPRFCVNNDRTGECLTAHSKYYHAFYDANSSNIGAAYSELINSTLDIATNTSHINLYKPQNGSSQNLLTVGKENLMTPQPNGTTTSGELKTQITAKKTIDGGQTDIGSNKFKFRLTGNGQDVTVENDESGDILFPEIGYTEPGTYTYTIEEITDDRDGVSFDFDDSVKTVTVTVTSHDVQTYDPNAVYYAFEEQNYDDLEYYYYVDTVPGNKGIVMYCTYHGVRGPQDPTGYTNLPAKDQTYRVVINPTIADIENNNWVLSNPYSKPGESLTDNLKKLFYYFETEDSNKIANGDKQSLVWTATGKTSKIESISVNGRPASNNAETVLQNIYETVTPPPSYNLAFFVPTGAQANKYPQPLATGYGADVSTTVNEVVFNNTTKAQNSLKIGKTVTGTAGETDRDFNFTISLMDRDWGTLSGTYTVIPNAIEGVANPSITSINFVGGIATVALKHGQNITITGLPDGFYYSISEAEWNMDGYTSSVTMGSSGNLSTSGGTGKVEVMFTNHKDSPSPSITYEAEIEATKRLDGKLPANGQFTFILRDAGGNEVSRKTNDANGNILFPLTFTEPGTYTYTIEELNDGQDGIIYDTEVITATVTVGNATLKTIMNGNRFVGSHDSNGLYITVDDTTQLNVFCINAVGGNPKGTYDTVFNPTTSDLAGQVTHNYYGTELSENMRKLMYYFDTHSYTDTVNNRVLNKSFRQLLVWSLTGYSRMQDSVYKVALATILAESNPPDNYTVVMFSPLQDGQPVAVGYLPDTNVVYSKGSAMAGGIGQTSETEEVLEFKNYYEYILPETGGMGTKGYAIGGLLLMGGALLLMYKNNLRAKRRVER